MFYLNKNSIYFVFLKFSFYRLSVFYLNLLFSLIIYSSGFIFWDYYIILRLFRSNYPSNLALYYLNYCYLAIKESLSMFIWLWSCVIYSSFIYFNFDIVYWIAIIYLSFYSIILKNFFFYASKNYAPFCFCYVYLSKVCEVSCIFVPNDVICSLN